MSYTATGSDTNTTAATALYNALTNSTIPEFQEKDWANPSNGTITATAKEAGKPFTITSAGTGTGTLTTTNGIANPTISSTSTNTTGGTLLDLTQYFYRITVTNPFGETAASAEANRTTGNSAANTNTITVNWSAPAGTGITGYRIYRSTSTNTEVLLATVGSTATSYVDTGATAGSTAYPTANTTVNSGPSDWNCPTNWSGGAVPVASDDVTIENNANDLLYNLNQTGITLTSLTINASFTGRIGLPDASESGGYAEYRATRLRIGVTTCTIGKGIGGGSGRIRWDGDSVQTACTVYATGQPIDPGIEALQINRTAANSTLTVYQGSVGVNVVPADTGTITTLRVGYRDNPASDATIRCTSGTTLTTINQNGGDVTVDGNVTTWTKTAGTSTQLSGTLTTLTQDGPSTFYPLGTGTITTATIRGQGSVLDGSKDIRAQTITTLTVTNGASLRDPWKRFTFTNPYATDPQSLAVSNLGNAPFNLQRS